MYVCVCMYACMHVYMHVCVCVCVCVYVCVCMCMCVYVYVYVCVCMCTCTCLTKSVLRVYIYAGWTLGTRGTTAHNYIGYWLPDDALKNMAAIKSAEPKNTTEKIDPTAGAGCTP